MFLFLAFVWYLVSTLTIMVVVKRCNIINTVWRNFVVLDFTNKLNKTTLGNVVCYQLCSIAQNVTAISILQGICLFLLTCNLDQDKKPTCYTIVLNKSVYINSIWLFSKCYICGVPVCVYIYISRDSRR